MTEIVLATEDELSEQVGLILAREAGLEVGQRLRKHGSGYLRSRIRSFCEMAERRPVFLLADLDSLPCASLLIAEWLDHRSLPPGLTFRVAVREVEAWLLADHDAVRVLLGGRVTRLPNTPDQLSDPKRTLLELAEKAPRNVRDDLIVRRGAAASQGLGYNARLCPWVRDSWLPDRAARRSDSLARARRRLKEMGSQSGIPSAH